MTSCQEKKICPHCQTPLQAVAIPPDSGWNCGNHLACFNDECPYFVEGWKWMAENYRVHASYRFRLVPGSDINEPLAVWSKDAIKDHIVEDQDDNNA